MVSESASQTGEKSGAQFGHMQACDGGRVFGCCWPHTRDGVIDHRFGQQVTEPFGDEPIAIRRHHDLDDPPLVELVVGLDTTRRGHGVAKVIIVSDGLESRTQSLRVSNGNEPPVLAIVDHLSAPADVGDDERQA